MLFDTQFNYCPLVWMFRSLQNNNNVKHLHERRFRRIQNDKLSSYEDLLNKDGSVSIHHRNIQGLAREILQIKHGQSCETVTDIFTQKTKEYNFRQNRDFRIPSAKNTVYLGSESTYYYQNLGNSSEKNKWIQFSNQIQKRNQKLGTTKLPSEALQAIYKWCWFSSVMSKVLALLFYY